MNETFLYSQETKDLVEWLSGKFDLDKIMGYHGANLLNIYVFDWD